MKKFEQRPNRDKEQQLRAKLEEEKNSWKNQQGRKNLW